jgi:rod shape determining protein RodA
LRRDDIIGQDVDWTTIFLFGILVFLGWSNIYAAGYDEELNRSLLDFSVAMSNAQRQLIFIGACIVLIVGIMVVDLRFFDAFGYVIYIIILFLLLLVPLIGKEVGGNKSWIGIGTFGVQPSEFAKFATALAVAKFIGSVNFRMDNFRNQVTLFVIIALPMGLVLLQKDFGTALVFTVFVLAFFREGMSPLLIILGISGAIIFVLTLLVPNQWYLHGAIAAILLIMIFLGKKRVGRIILLTAGALLIMGLIESVDYMVNNMLKPHHQNRLKALINPDADPRGYGWNVTQSKIAIGSGGFSGKGFLKGTQTKFDFVPEQDTDFIFCTIGEEHGWIGSVIVVGLFVAFLLRLVYIAERQKQRFARAFGYSVVSIFFFHFAVNIGMTIGLFPVIGIPLPFFSYGGSALMGFTVLLFILLKLDSHRGQVLQRI